MSSGKKLTYIYRFRRAGRVEKEFVIDLDAETLTLLPQAKTDFPDWTRLEHEKCSNCPLNEKDTPRCPAAVALAEPINYFKDRVSFDEYEIEITDRKSVV